MDFSKLSYSQVTDYATQLSSCSGQMEALLQEITNLFNNVGDDNTWSGTAANDTKAKFDTLSTKFPEFSSAIAECSKYLLDVVANYQAVDNIVQGNQQ